MLLSAASMTPLLVMLLLVAASATCAPDQKSRAGDYACKLDDSECLKKYMQNEVIANFGAGFPEYGVKSFDPLYFNDLTFDYDVKPGLQVSLRHVSPILYGLAKTRVLDVRTIVTGSSFTMEISISIPKLYYEGTYTCKGDVMLFPINWSGTFNMTLGDITDTWKLSADVVEKGTDTYLSLQSVSIQPKVETFKTCASGLFWGYEKIGDFAVQMTNRYWHRFYDAMWKMAEPYVTRKVSGAVSSILLKKPFKVPTPKSLNSSTSLDLTTK